MTSKLDMKYNNAAIARVQERQAKYGDPWESFSRIAKVWSGILGVDVLPSQVCMCMSGIKNVREQYSHHDDNLTDDHGYTILKDFFKGKELLLLQKAVTSVTETPVNGEMSTRTGSGN